MYSEQYYYPIYEPAYAPYPSIAAGRHWPTDWVLPERPQSVWPFQGNQAWRLNSAYVPIIASELAPVTEPSLTPPDRVPANDPPRRVEFGPSHPPAPFLLPTDNGEPIPNPEWHEWRRRIKEAEAEAKQADADARAISLAARRQRPRSRAGAIPSHSLPPIVTIKQEAYSPGSVADVFEDTIIIEDYIPSDGSQPSPANNSEVVVFQRYAHVNMNHRPHVACFFCKHRKIKCDEKVYDENGRPYCEPCCERQGPCYWPERYYPYLEADYLAAYRKNNLDGIAATTSHVDASPPSTTSSPTVIFIPPAPQPAYNNELLAEALAGFDPTNCPKRTSWTYGKNEATGRNEFDNLPHPEEGGPIPKQRRATETYWWEQW